jgi:predicted RNA-binding protein with PUA-like domain
MRGLSMQYWLFKTEPDAFSIDDLANMPNQIEHWDGIRNYQARNFLRDDMKLGDLLLIYHSSCKNIGIVGLAEVVKEGYVDHTQFDPESHYYDPKSLGHKPRWIMVDIQFKQKFVQMLSLKDIKKMTEITDIGLVKKGHRLSIMPVKKNEFERLLEKCLKRG